MESSSGILGHAIAANKPIIGPAHGLLGALIEQYNLGITYKGEFRNTLFNDYGASISNYSHPFHRKSNSFAETFFLEIENE